MQRVNHHHLYIFWLFGKFLSFTKTANELRIAQSAVTSQIKNLEESLGLNLVDRQNPKRPELTESGKKILEYADSIFESTREMINWATQGDLPKKRIIRIGSLSGLSRNLQYEFIKPVMGRPEYKIEVSTGDQENLLSQLKNHEIDVILTSQNVTFDSRVHFYTHVLASSPILFVCGRGAKIKRSADLKTLLEGRDLYKPGRHFEARAELEAYLEKNSSQYRLAGEIDDIALLRIFALKSKGIVVVPEMGVFGDIQKGDVKVLAKVSGIQQRFYAITRDRLRPQTDIDFLIKAMRKSSS